MKKFTFVFASLLCVSFMAMAQLKLYVYQNDGERTEFVAANVDSIAFSASAGPSAPDANGHEYVDLGLPSGNLWATMNVGATTPEEVGNYFAWGDIVSDFDKFRFSWKSYKFMEKGMDSYLYINKYTVVDEEYNGIWYDAEGEFIGDGKTFLDLEDDIARINMGGDWCMPTRNEAIELVNNCNAYYINLGGKRHVELISRLNKKSLILPLTGAIEYSESATMTDLLAYYWTNTLSTESNAAMFFGYDIRFDDYTLFRMERCTGLPVRGVLHTK